MIERQWKRKETERRKKIKPSYNVAAAGQSRWIAFCKQQSKDFSPPELVSRIHEVILFVFTFRYLFYGLLGHIAKLGTTGLFNKTSMEVKVQLPWLIGQVVGTERNAIRSVGYSHPCSAAKPVLPIKRKGRQTSARPSQPLKKTQSTT